RLAEEAKALTQRPFGHCQVRPFERERDLTGERELQRPARGRELLFARKREGEPAHGTLPAPGRQAHERVPGLGAADELGIPLVSLALRAEEDSLAGADRL